MARKEAQVELGDMVSLTLYLAKLNINPQISAITQIRFWVRKQRGHGSAFVKSADTPTLIHGVTLFRQIKFLH